MNRKLALLPPDPQRRYPVIRYEVITLMPTSSTDISSPFQTPSTWGLLLPIAVSALGLLMVAYLGYLLQEGYLPLVEISRFKLVNFTFTMQLCGVIVSLAGMLALFVFDHAAFRIFFRFRFRLSSPDDAASTWAMLGPALLIIFSLGAIAMMSFNVTANNGTVNETFFLLLPLVLIFAATNAWTEEILSRFILVAGLSGKLPSTTICWISAVIFGFGHVRGTPSGVFGVIITGTLGWLLAKSVIETKSLGWTLLIHFFMDVVIFGAGAMVLAGSV
ncbi:MAG TPA: CPBP family intramembrane glutamic endopeptidase [Chryseolinea sp.]|nr:CPBP family intramembrane glutamic endopeptidase [Chryseolinea sp.]